MTEKIKSMNILIPAKRSLNTNSYMPKEIKKFAKTKLSPITETMARYQGGTIQ